MKWVFVLASAAMLSALGGCGHDATSPQQAEQVQPVQQPEHNGAQSATKEANAHTQDAEHTDAEHTDAEHTDAEHTDAEHTGSDADAMTLYRQAQSLMKAGKPEEGYETAKKAMAQFIAEDNDLAWMLLESLTLKDRRVDVHFNMGPSERHPPDDGIVRPLSFRVWSTGDDERRLEIIDFEIGRMDGEPLTAAIGTTFDGGHGNYGILPIDASYEAIKKAVLEVVDRKTDAKE